MAFVTLKWKLLMAAVERADTVLRPQMNQLGGAWPRNEQMLADIRLAALWVEQHGYAGEQVGLTVQEAQLLEPYIKP